jgi:hypothetical protein
MVEVTNLELDANNRAWADSNATAAYYNALAQGQTTSAAQAAAQFAWKQKMDEASQTGMWNGQYNMPTEQNFANMFGSWMPQGPNTGQQTLTAQQQEYNQAYQNSQLYGQYFAPGAQGAPAVGQQTLVAQNQANQLGLSQANLTGYYVAPGSAAGAQGQQTLAGQQQQFSQGLQTEQEARAAQAQGQSQTMSYLNLLSSLRGPADWAKYQQVLGSTPGGMRDLAAAAMGQYVPGGGATTGYAPQAASLQSMMGQIAGQPYYGQGGGQLQQPNVYQGGQGSYGQPSGQVWGSGIGVGQQPTTPEQQAQAAGGGANTMGQMPAPNQIAAQSWKNLAPSQQQMLLGGYEAQGWDKNDVTALMNQSLPKYTGGATGVGSYRLQ